ncbi:hypothetical protein MP638_006914 [Amoeboaphelidium occidentale]|nr:hypothetical protein MP638_006914 [Amoeboaphelidium occidentale]
MHKLSTDPRLWRVFAKPISKSPAALPKETQKKRLPAPAIEGADTTRTNRQASSVPDKLMFDKVSFTKFYKFMSRDVSLRMSSILEGLSRGLQQRLDAIKRQLKYVNQQLATELDYERRSTTNDFYNDILEQVNGKPRYSISTIIPRLRVLRRHYYFKKQQDLLKKYSHYNEILRDYGEYLQVYSASEIVHADLSVSMLSPKYSPLESRQIIDTSCYEVENIRTSSAICDKLTTRRKVPMCVAFEGVREDLGGYLNSIKEQYPAMFCECVTPFGKSWQLCQGNQIGSISASSGLLGV